MDNTPLQPCEDLFENLMLDEFGEYSGKNKVSYVKYAMDKLIAHVRPQIEAEARACAVEDFIAWSVATYDDLLEADKKELRALATLPSGYCVVPVEPTEPEAPPVSDEDAADMGRLTADFPQIAKG